MHNASKMLSIMAEKLFCLDGLQRYHKYQSRKKNKEQSAENHYSEIFNCSPFSLYIKWSIKKLNNF